MPHEFIITEEVRRAWGNRPIPTEQPVIEWARQLQDKKHSAIDVGAHVGDWAVDMAQHSEKVYAFEPQAKIWPMLVANAHYYPNLVCLPCALGAKKAKLPLYWNPDGSGGTSLLKTPMHPGEVLHTIQVNTLDSYKLNNVSLIKIDVEGHEIEVLKGALKTIARCKPKIIFEAWSYPWFKESKRALMKYILCDLKPAYKVVPLNWPDMFIAEPTS